MPQMIPRELAQTAADVNAHTMREMQRSYREEITRLECALAARNKTIAEQKIVIAELSKRLQAKERA